MDKDDEIQELRALLRQEESYAKSLKRLLAEVTSLQSHLISGLEVWKAGFEKLFHEHHMLAGSPQSSSCCICLREHEFPITELVPVRQPAPGESIC